MHIAVYRIAQEALSNIARHAKARSAWVRLTLSPSRVQVVVSDDGRGFSPGRPLDPSHLGLVSMRERAEEPGGELTVSSAPGEGTVVTFVRPAGDAPAP